MKNLIALIIGILIIAPSFLSINTMAWVYTNTYPYQSASHCGCQSDPWGFYKRQCTSYVAWKINESGRSFSNGMVGPNGKSGWFGNAGNWDDNARNVGFSISSSPVTRSVAVWDPGACSGCSVGHVAWVENKNNNNTAYISEYNWNYGDGNYNERNNITASRYIVLANLCGGTNVELNNYNTSGPLNCTSSNLIKITPESVINSINGSANFKII